MRGYISTLGLITGLVSSIAASPALAQTSPAPSGTASEINDGDIIVTAQRRAQNAQDVPISIAAASGEALEAAGITSSEGLASAFPGLQIQRTTGGASPFLRGVGSTNTGLGTSRAVALYVDDIYINSAASNAFGLGNVSTIEVAKGPQGTLFGRNATGGVIQVRTKNPGSDPGLDMEVGYANFDTITGSLYADAQITDVLAVNLAVAGRDQRNGWGLNVPTNQDIYLGGFYSIRAKALIDTGDTSLLITGDYYSDDEDFGLNRQALPGFVQIGGAGYVGKYRATLGQIDIKKNNNWGISGNFKHDFDDVSLISITGMRRSDLFFTLDQDGSPPRLLLASLSGVTDSFSEELRLQSKGSGPFSWLVGAFYYWERAAYRPLHITGSAFARPPFNGSQSQQSRQTLNSLSGFIDGTYEISPSTRVTAGLRYTSDKYKENTQTFNANGALIPGTQLAQSLKNSAVTWRVVLDHRINDNVLAYASYSRGFRSGGFVLTSPLAAGLEPEVIDAFEAGIKTDLFDRRLRFNLAGYYYDYRKLQVSVIQSGLVGSVNAGAAEVYGADAELSWKVTDALTLRGAANYLHSQYTSFPNGPFFIPNPAVCGNPPTRLPGAPTGGNLQCAVNLAGYDTPHAPRVTANVGADYEFDTSIGTFLFGASYYYNDGFTFEADNQVRQGSYNLVNASVTWTAPSRKYDVRVWGNNLLDEYYYGNISRGTSATSGGPAAPLTYGVSLGVHF